MRIGLLGPVIAGPDGAPAPGGVRLRGALARLALDAGRTVSRDVLVDALWGAEPPDAVTNALQALVARLRRALGADVVETVPGGYRLAVDPHDVDALRFESLVAAARGLDPAKARALLVEAMALWRGPALADVRQLPFGDVAAARLDELRATAVELSADAALLLGDPGAELDALGTLLAAEPTRLAREVVRTRPGESSVVELAPVGAPDRLVATVLDAVSSAEIVARIPDEVDVATRLIDALADRELLLVLDNCEHLVDAAAHLAQILLERVPGLRILATSREPLAVAGEMLHPVDALADDDSVRLFAERGAAVAPGFTVTAALRPAVLEICRRLDGQPLALELAAARLRTLTPDEIRRRLDDRFRLLTTGPRTAQPRHQTLRAVVDWSWDLLDDQERALARRLSVFAGGATEEAALRVGGLGEATLDVLTALVEKSLLVAVPGDPSRYRMLETIREYAAQRLDEAGEQPAVEAAHTALVVELVETAEPRLRRTDQLEWVARLRAETDDVAAVLRRASRRATRQRRSGWWPPPPGSG